MAGRIGALLLLEPHVEAPSSVLRRFSVWCGVFLPPDIKSVQELCQRVLAMVPDRYNGWDDVEVLVKAGEGGSWQARWLHPGWGDPHPLAIDSASGLEKMHAEAAHYAVTLTPYITVRRSGNQDGQDWTASEQHQVRECWHAASRVVLNVEPGDEYDNGPKIPSAIEDYLLGTRVPKRGLEVCSIPREMQVQQLGGPRCMYAWTSNAGAASWECYGLASRTLRVDVAIPKIVINGWAPDEPQYQIPVVQKGESERWADTEWATPGYAVWHLTGD